MILPSKEFLDVFKATNGALSVTESIAIMNIAAQARNVGEYIEFGTYHGKSSMSAVIGLNIAMEVNVFPKGFILVDPLFEDEKICLQVSELINKFSHSKLIPKCKNEYSTEYLLHSDIQPSFVFIDSGSHQDGLPMQEAKLLEDRMVQGGIIAFHDWNSQFSEVKEASDYLVGTGKFEYIPINWHGIIAYVNANNLEEGNNSWHHTELKNPCFVGAVKRK